MSFVTVDASSAIRAIDNITKAMEEGAKAGLLRIGEEMVQGAKEIVPVDTGRLQASIEVKQLTDESVTVGSDVEYAADVEFGTFKQQAQPYLGPQVDRMMSAGPAIISDEIRRRLR